MLLTAKQLFKLTARTQSGQVLGRVSDIEYDADSQQILRYRVSPTRTLQRLVNGQLSIHRSQVISISETELVADDLLTKIQTNNEVASTVAMASATNAPMSSVIDAASS